MQTSLKTGFAQISLAAQKIWPAQNLGAAVGGGAPPPGPYAYAGSWSRKQACSWRLHFRDGAKRCVSRKITAKGGKAGESKHKNLGRLVVLS